MTDYASKIFGGPIGGKMTAPPQTDYAATLFNGGIKEAPASEPESEPDKGVLDKAAGYAKAGYQAVSDAVTGDKSREFDLPAFLTDAPVPTMTWEALRMGMAYGTSPDEHAVADVIEKNLPEAKRSQDKFGNEVISWQGKDYYVNPPGLDMTDALQFAPQAIMATGAGKFGTRGRTMPRRIVRTGAAEAGVSGALDIVSGGLGSDQGVDLQRMAIAGGGGALFEGLSPAAAKVWRTIFKNRALYDPQAGTLTAAGARWAERAGVDIEDMNQRVTAVFAREAEDAVTPQAAMARAYENEFDIPYTTGQASGDFDQIAREEAMRSGAMGDEAGSTLRSFDETQADRMVGARDRLQRKFSGSDTVATREADAVGSVAEDVQAAAQARKGAVRQAYEDAGQRGADVMGDAFDDLATRVGRINDEFPIDEVLNPAAKRAVKDLEGLVERGWDKGSVPLEYIDGIRKRLGRYAKAAGNDADREALRQLKNELDGWLDDTIEKALFSGDDAALETLKKARRLRRQYGELFEQRDPYDTAGKIIEKLRKADPTPEEVVGYIFGRGKLGQKTAAAKTVERLKSIFGDDSPQTNALKEAVWMRLTRDVGREGFSAQKYATSLNEAMTQNASLLKSLYSAEELKTMRSFRDAVMRTVPPKRATNPSGSGYTAARLVRDFTRRLGTMFTFSGQPGLGAAFFGLARTPGLPGGIQARQAVRGVKPRKPSAPAFVGTGTAATTMMGEE